MKGRGEWQEPSEAMGQLNSPNTGAKLVTRAAISESWLSDRQLN